MIILSLMLAVIIFLMLVYIEPDRGDLWFLLTLVFTFYTFPEKEFHYGNNIEVEVFISAGSSTETQGYFTIFGGSVGSTPVYKLRKVIGDNKYKDFIVKDVILEETDELTGKGLYIQEALCPTSYVESYFWFTSDIRHHEWTYWDCKDRVDTLKVPKGSVVKHIQL